MAEICDLKMTQSTILTNDQLMTGMDRNVIATTGHQDKQLRKGITTHAHRVSGFPMCFRKVQEPGFQPAGKKKVL